MAAHRGQRPLRAGVDTVFIDNRVLHGVAGYQVVTPVKIDGGERYVLVQPWLDCRGGPTAARCRRLSRPRGPLRITGLAVVPSERPIRNCQRARCRRECLAKP